MVQVKRIISMNKIQSAGKAHHQMLEKGGTYTVQYAGQIFHAFDELYLLIISVFNTTGNVMCFPSQESTRVQNFLVLTFITFCHKY